MVFSLKCYPCIYHPAKLLLPHSKTITQDEPKAPRLRLMETGAWELRRCCLVRCGAGDPRPRSAAGGGGRCRRRARGGLCGGTPLSAPGALRPSLPSSGAAAGARRAQGRTTRPERLCAAAVRRGAGPGAALQRRRCGARPILTGTGGRGGRAAPALTGQSAAMSPL